MSLRDVGTIKDTTTITLLHPVTGKPLLNADETPMTVVLHGPYSERYKTILREQQQRRMTDMSRAARAATMTPEEIDAFANELLVRCIEDWSITLEGDEKLAYSQASVESVLVEFPWVKDQINAVLGNIADFLEPPKRH
jgi:hypothetical protein